MHNFASIIRNVILESFSQFARVENLLLLTEQSLAYWNVRDWDETNKFEPVFIQLSNNPRVFVDHSPRPRRTMREEDHGEKWRLSDLKEGFCVQGVQGSRRRTNNELVDGSSASIRRCPVISTRARCPPCRKEPLRDPLCICICEFQSSNAREE